MTDTAFHRVLPQDAAEDVALPAPVPFDAPVLIGDCVTPLAGETVLTLLWRRLTQSEAE